jgi:hypothetical protein
MYGMSILTESGLALLPKGCGCSRASSSLSPSSPGGGHDTLAAIALAIMSDTADLDREQLAAIRLIDM